VNVVNATAVADDSFVWLTVGFEGGGGTWDGWAAGWAAGGAAGSAAAWVVLGVDAGELQDQLHAHEQLHAWLCVNVVVVPSGRVQVQVHVHVPA
jgi:hypothetical protein